MKKPIDQKKIARRSFLRLITGFSAAASGVFLGLISPAQASSVQQEGSDSSDQSEGSDSSDQSGRSSSDSDSSDQSEGSDSSDRAASDSDSDSSDSSGR